MIFSIIMARATIILYLFIWFKCIKQQQFTLVGANILFTLKVYTRHHHHKKLSVATSNLDFLKVLNKGVFLFAIKLNNFSSKLYLQ